MTQDRIEPSAEASEADVLDQLAAVVPDPEDEDRIPGTLAAAEEPVSEADWLEQQLEVPLDDEADDEDAES
ncbi:hypothetical protein [Leucobacter massiliensis]|uniref:Uncharacterized protein n=1 Tax=Leucobacter massiliensis TaxID=1686285 RepID=A0A2S9QQJ2_9MICO|nr:hypothetical protein [Leucobacter massiliensis]PRI11842.1 hypothetical protein B4915_05275 [Leucobacter massiliensis]